jgi:uncharacterized membrane protein YkgB
LWTAWFSLLNAAYLTWVGCLKLISTTPDFSIAVELLAGACLFAYRSRQGLRIGALLASIVYAGNLLYLLTAPAWLADMGGFPFLGSGQGTIKYIPMLATTLYLLAQTTANPSMGERHAAHVGWAGIVLVMGWIGAMKFFPFEAEGIEPLLRGHWVFDWMYGFWDIQGVSNIIGTVELLFAVTLVAGMVWEKLMPFALAGIAVTVACTTSFMFTLPGWAPDAHFPLLNGSGVFLLKDQFLLAAMLLVCGARNKSTN